jgi:hypothetical protein
MPIEIVKIALKKLPLVKIGAIVIKNSQIHSSGCNWFQITCDAKQRYSVEYSNLVRPCVDHMVPPLENYYRLTLEELANRVISGMHGNDWKGQLAGALLNYKID